MNITSEFQAEQQSVGFGGFPTLYGTRMLVCVTGGIKSNDRLLSFYRAKVFFVL